MSDTTFINPNGTLTMYAFACGYLETWDGDGRTGDYYLTADAVTLYRDGVWHVKAHRADSEVNGMPVWESFDYLTDARRYVRKVRTAIRRGRPTPPSA